MVGKSNIEWTEQSWNPLAGCTILTAGCSKCYAMKMAARLERMGQALYAGLTEPSKAGPVWTGVMRQASEHVLLAPLKRKKPTTYFVNSMSDLFHENVPDEWIDAIFAVMAMSPQHTFQVLTKRAKRMREYMSRPTNPRRFAEQAEIEGRNLFGSHPGLRTTNWSYGKERMPECHWPLPNVWLGVSTERQQEADERIPLLLQTPAAIRFISAEPLLGPIRLDRLIREGFGKAYVDDALTGFVSNRCGGSHGAKLDWVIAGAESGSGARPMPLEWALSLRDQCRDADVRFFMKQLSGPNGRAVKDIVQFPPDLQVREMPHAA